MPSAWQMLKDVFLEIPKRKIVLLLSGFVNDRAANVSSFLADNNF